MELRIGKIWNSEANFRLAWMISMHIHLELKLRFKVLLEVGLDVVSFS
jgi:hypothetical protein